MLHQTAKYPCNRTPGLVREQVKMASVVEPQLWINEKMSSLILLLNHTRKKIGILVKILKNVEAQKHVIFAFLIKQFNAWEHFLLIARQTPRSETQKAMAVQKLGMCVAHGYHTWLQSQQLGFDSRHPAKYCIKYKTRDGVRDPGNESYKKTRLRTLRTFCQLFCTCRITAWIHQLFSSLDKGTVIRIFTITCFQSFNYRYLLMPTVKFGYF